VSNHGLDDLVTKQFATAREFFELPTERKMEIMVDKYHRFGVMVLMDAMSDAGRQRTVCACIWRCVNIHRMSSCCRALKCPCSGQFSVVFSCRVIISMLMPCLSWRHE